MWMLLLPSALLRARDEKSPSTGEAMRSFWDESAGWRFRIPCRFMTGLPGALLGLEDGSIVCNAVYPGVYHFSLPTT